LAATLAAYEAAFAAPPDSRDAPLRRELVSVRETVCRYPGGEVEVEVRTEEVVHVDVPKWKSKGGARRFVASLLGIAPDTLKTMMRRHRKKMREAISTPHPHKRKTGDTRGYGHKEAAPELRDRRRSRSAASGRTRHRSPLD
jgi:hypothetical protein